MIRFLRLLAVAVLIADGALIAVAPGEAAERDATYSSNELIAASGPTVIF